MRTVPEWHGATLDTPVPTRVRLRVFARDDGCCQICTRKIAAAEKWVCDHIIAIVNGGENREQNLQTICGWCDRNIKTPADVAEKSKVAQSRGRHLGIKKRQGRPLPGTRASGIRKRMDGRVERW